MTSANVLILFITLHICIFEPTSYVCILRSRNSCQKMCEMVVDVWTTLRDADNRRNFSVTEVASSLAMCTRWNGAPREVLDR